MINEATDLGDYPLKSRAVIAEGGTRQTSGQTPPVVIEAGDGRASWMETGPGPRERHMGDDGGSVTSCDDGEQPPVPRLAAQRPGA